MSCINQQPLADPPVSEASGYQVVIINEEGETVLLSRPTNDSELVCVDGSIYWADGTDTYPVKLPNISETNSAFRGIFIKTNTGRMYSLVNDTSTNQTLQCVSGVWSLVDVEADLPQTGNGVLRRSVSGVVDYLSTKGIPHLTTAGELESIPDNSVGKVLKIGGDGNPQWMDELSGTPSTGAGKTGLETVVAHSIDNTTVTIAIPSFTVTNGTLQKTYSNVTLTVDITAGVGPGGMETGGSESASEWYYVYVISDGTGMPGGVISTSPIVPDLSDVAFTGGGYTYYGFCTVFRNNAASNIVPFYQKGRKFWIDSTYGLMLNGGVVTTSMAAVPEGIGSGALPLASIIPPITMEVDGLVSGTTVVNGYLISGWDGVSIGTFGVGTQFIVFFGDNGSGVFYSLPIFNPSSPRIAHKALSHKTDRVVRLTAYKI